MECGHRPLTEVCKHLFATLSRSQLNLSFSICFEEHGSSCNSEKRMPRSTLCKHYINAECWTIAQSGGVIQAKVQVVAVAFFGKWGRTHPYIIFGWIIAKISRRTSIPLQSYVWRIHTMLKLKFVYGMFVWFYFAHIVSFNFLFPRDTTPNAVVFVCSPGSVLFLRMVFVALVIAVAVNRSIVLFWCVRIVQSVKQQRKQITKRRQSILHLLPYPMIHVRSI